MLQTQDALLERLIIHHAGNKANEESLRCSNEDIAVQDAYLEEKLNQYFLSAFKEPVYYRLTHDTDVKQNAVYEAVAAIFENASEFTGSSKAIAQRLYDVCEHPNIKPGELYVTSFRNIKWKDEPVKAIGIFKTEGKKAFMKIEERDLNFKPLLDEGISLDKIDKAALIMNVDGEEGFRLCVVDNSSKGDNAQYWKDRFLQVLAVQDNYQHTQNYMQLCKKYVQEGLPVSFEVDKADQIDLLNRSANFFKKNERFNETAFEEEVIQQPKVIDAFRKYKQEYAQEQGTQIMDDFDISAPAVKKQSRVFKSVLKLDKNFHVYIHGDRELIERGVDENTGMSYYKIFFKEEQ